jgi:hypothetical protein
MRLSVAERRISVLVPSRKRLASRSGNRNAVVLRLGENRKKVRQLQHIAQLFTKVKQLELTSLLASRCIQSYQRAKSRAIHVAEFC